jgi:hypothetical protein
LRNVDHCTVFQQKRRWKIGIVRRDERRVEIVTFFTVPIAAVQIASGFAALSLERNVGKGLGAVWGAGCEKVVVGGGWWGIREGRSGIAYSSRHVASVSGKRWDGI